MVKKRVSATLAISTLGMVVGGIQPSGAQTQNTVTLTMWVNDWGHQYDQMFTNAVQKYFVATHPNIRVNIEYFPNYPGQKLLTAVAAGKGPDLTYMNSAQGQLFAMNGALMTLDSFYKSIHVDPVKDFTANINASYTWGGHVYAVGVGSDNVAIFWNKDAFKAAGLNPNTLATIQQIEQDNKKLLEIKNGRVVRAGLVAYKSVYAPYWIGAAFGATQLYDLKTHKAMVDTPQMVKAFQWAVSDVNLAGVDKLDRASGGWGSGVNDPFYTGQEAIIVDGWWRVLDAKQNAPKLNYGVAPLPHSISGLSWGFAIPTGSQHLAAAEEFLTWLLTDKNATAAMADGTNPWNFRPTLPIWYQEVAKLSKGTPMEAYMGTWKNIIDNITTNNYNNPAPAAYDQWLYWALDQAVHHKMTPQAALAQAQQQIQLEINKNLAAAKIR